MNSKTLSKTSDPVAPLEKREIWIAAGGTGGHISPGVAIAETLSQKKIPVLLFTLSKNLSYPDIERLIREEPGIHVIPYPAPRLPQNVLQLPAFISALWKSYRIIASAKTRPSHILAMGGFPSVPLLLYAILHNIPYSLAEQNAHKGMVTNLFSNKAKNVFHSFEQMVRSPQDIFSGNPLRKAFRTVKPSAVKTTSFPQKILMIGGSQGANDINSLYLSLSQNPLFAKTEFTVSTGPAAHQEIQRQARKKDKIYSFITNMPNELKKTDLVIARSGAGTLYEIIWAGKPALFLPYPHAAGDHQKANAASAASFGFAVCYDERPFSAPKAAEAVSRIIEVSYASMAAKAKDAANYFPLTAHLSIAEKILE